jgi:hypothetical protein
MAKAPAPFKPPKSLAVCADLLYTTKNERLAVQKTVDALEAKERILREHLISNLPKSDASGISGKVARATVENKTIVTVTSYDDLHKYILANAKKTPGVWGLLQKRVSDATVKDLWAAKKKIPGVEPMFVPVVSLNKL